MDLNCAVQKSSREKQKNPVEDLEGNGFRITCLKADGACLMVLRSHFPSLSFTPQFSSAQMSFPAFQANAQLEDRIPQLFMHKSIILICYFCGQTELPIVCN